MRASALGWSHAVDDATWVLHHRESSFGAEKAALVQRNRATLDELHPRYTPLVRAFVASDELQTLREHTREQFAQAERRGAPPLPRLLFVLHVGGGGVPATSGDLMRGLAARYDCLALTSDGATMRLSRWEAGGMRELEQWRLETPWQAVDFERPDVAAIARHVLTAHAVELDHVRHLFRHTLDLPLTAETLGIPVIVSFHDFYLSCPTIHLLDEDHRYCAGICTPGDGACQVPPTMGPIPPLKHRWIHDWRRRIAPVLENADALVTTSEHIRFVYRRTYPGIADVPFTLIPHGRDLEQASGVAVPPEPGEPVRILVPGNIGEHKGARVLAELKALDTEERVELHFLGLVPPAFLHLGVQHGAYERDQFLARVREIGPSFAAILSITAESYSHTLTEAWAAGIPVVASDLGALSERIGAQGGGWLVPHDDPAEVLRRILEIADDPDEYRREQARAVVRETSVADMAQAYADLYGEVADRRRAFRPRSPDTAPEALSPAGR
jgi:glycosyltransferase involved in cell wall biosynthesis